MTTYEDAPWLAQYRSDTPTTIDPPTSTMIDTFDCALAARPDGAAIRYFDNTITYADLGEAANAFACALAAAGIGPGDRVALYLQNDPSFVIGLIGIWKAGGIAVTVNPMNKSRELAELLIDSGAKALLCLDTLYETVVTETLSETEGLAAPAVFITGSADFRSRRSITDPSTGDRRPPRLIDVLADHRGKTPAPHRTEPGDAAVLVYTSGTTGRPKAAVNTHRGMSYNAYTYRAWLDLTSDDVILGVAPLFHITGLVGHICAALASSCAVTLTDRFDPVSVLAAMRRDRPTYTVAAITALRSLLSASSAPRDDFGSLRALYSGGAPIAPAFAEEFRERTGASIHNIYGLTETTSPSHAVPLGATAPVDPQSGALSIGVPVFGTTARVVDEDGEPVPIGQLGEIAISGPQVIEQYWNRPDQSAESIIDGELRTGDIGYMNDDGWFFIVDRKKDMINASGYKVWPREVEDYLYGHPAVLEAAVVGVPDPYRGETVKAFVALRDQHACTESELIEYCKRRMAAYKYPREIEFVSDIPKTLTGKILRRELRNVAGQTPASERAGEVRPLNG